MKKLMVAFAAVAMAVCAQAAAVEWGSGAVYAPGTPDTKIGQQTGDYVMTLAFFQNVEGSWVEMTGVTGISDDSTAKASKFAGTTSESFVGGTTYGVIATIVNDKYTLTTDMAQFVAALNGNTGLTFDDGTGFSKTVTFNTKSIGSEGDTGVWVAAPEPTSGLLLLIGMAGLALRRRRA